MIDTIKKIEYLLKLPSKVVYVEQIKHIDYFPNISYSTTKSQNINGLRIRCYELNNNYILIAEIFKLIELIKDLKILNLSINKLSNLKSIKLPSSINELYLINCGLDQIEIIDNRNLRLLDLSNNNLVQYEKVNMLTKLKYLNLSYNKLTKFNLDNAAIEFLNIEVNPLKEINVSNSLNLKVIKIEFTQIREEVKNDIDSLLQVPIEIYENGNKSIIEWLEAERRKLNEVKINLTGDPKAGKTSLLNRLKNNSYSNSQGQTDGINIEVLKFGELQTFESYDLIKDYTGRFWDFGGQEILNSTHKYFFSYRTIYILVLEARADVDPEEKIDLWIKRISSYAGQSNVIIVVNKIEILRSFELDSTKLLYKYPQIISILYVSCENNEGIEELKKILEKTIPESDIFNTEIDTKWIRVKEKLEKFTTEKHYINENIFLEICKMEKITSKDDRDELIDFLHDLGIILHFKQLFYSDLYVLDPYWITAGTYRIVTSPFAASRKGRICFEDVLHILNDELRQNDGYLSEKQNQIKFTSTEAKYIIESMSLFRLSHFDDRMRTILIPDLFTKNSPFELFDSTLASIKIAYKFEYLPPYVVHNLILDLQGDIIESWRTGCIIKSKESLGEIKSIIYTDNEVLNVKIFGSYPENSGYLSIIRFLINNTCSRNNLRYKLQIPLDDNFSRLVDYEILINMKRSHENTYKDWSNNISYSIDKLLFGIEREENIIKYVISDDARKSLDNLEKMYKQLIVEMQKNSIYIQDVTTKLDKLLLNNLQLNGSISKLSINNNYVELLINTINNSIDIISENKNAHKELIEEWKQTNDKIKSITNANSKFKLSIPFLLPILTYEQELSFDTKKIISGVIEDIERGINGNWIDAFLIKKNDT